MAPTIVTSSLTDGADLVEHLLPAKNTLSKLFPEDATVYNGHELISHALRTNDDSCMGKTVSV